MKYINSGGPAFPIKDGVSHDRHDGMYLRDYFAAKAINSLMRTVQKGGKTGPDADDTDMDWVARRAYMMADAMLIARG